MKLRTIVIAGVILGACELCGPAGAAAQFETPNRSFHNASTFRLDGRHAQVQCESCHLNKQYKGTPRTCFECHWVRRKDDRYQTRLGTQCEQCHTTSAWTDVRWNHATQAGLALNASHTTLGCESCHRGGQFRAGGIQCASCHQKDYAATRSPNHAAAGFPVTCERCHSPGESTWRSRGGEGFSHAAIYPLVGVHATAACESCHRGNTYRGTPRECAACHQADYNRTQNPNHAAAGFPTTCDTCHRPTDPTFAGAVFNHTSVFALVGVHATQTCATCHKGNVYRGTPRECIGCHQDAYSRTTTPNHAAAGFPSTCETCHRPTDPQWRGATFNHTAAFALVGVHGSQPCATCHKNNVYRGTPRECAGCHQDAYNRTTNPNHAAAGLPTTCETCHRPTDPQWSSGTGFNHNAVFPLVGVHVSQTCVACHKNNVYRGTARTCVGCHQDAYNRTTAPNHAAAGFSTACETCHRATDSQWRGATFNHASVFPLLGVHAGQACATCHRNGVYRGTARECVGCHLDAYNASRNPGHAAAGFPTTCAGCHRATDSTWQQGTFTHRFPRTGPHNVDCVRCHTTAGNFVVYSCTVCHDRAETDNEHRGRTGYRYESTACYACHPNGRS